MNRLEQLRNEAQDLDLALFDAQDEYDSLCMGDPEEDKQDALEVIKEAQTAIDQWEAINEAEFTKLWKNKQ